MVTAMTSFKRILVGVDGSENALRAASFAAALAKGFGSEITLAHVIAPSDHDLLVGKATYADKDFKVGGERLKGAERLLEQEGVPFRSTVEFGHPAEQLLRLAEGHDLIVVGTRGLSPFKGILIGSTSTRLAQGSKVPVTIVP
ncbi:MAG: universal stress protein [Euryarchaeota archaeon]|nr:universal stress protein [Euryarchaeota archaeon]